MTLNINLHNFLMTAKTFESTLSNGIRIQTDSDKWKHDPNSTQRTSIKRITKNYTQENQLDKYKTEGVILFQTKMWILE